MTQTNPTFFTINKDEIFTFFVTGNSERHFMIQLHRIADPSKLSNVLGHPVGLSIDVHVDLVVLEAGDEVASADGLVVGLDVVALVEHVAALHLHATLPESGDGFAAGCQGLKKSGFFF